MNILRMKCTKSTIFVFAMLLTCISCSVSREDQLQRRADRGDIQAMMELAAANESLTGGGFIRKPNTGKSKELYRKAAALGHTPAMYVLSQFLSDSITNEERVMWLKKGAELGNKACLIELVNAYEQGLYGLSRDPDEAKGWQKKVRAACEEELRQQGYSLH